jgi:hypothetical protein
VHDPNEITVRISPRTVRRVLFAAVALLTVASVGVWILIKYQLDSPRNLWVVGVLDSREEANVPTWFASLCLLACSLISATIASSAEGKESRYRRHWIALSVIFFAGALDEAVLLHERVSVLLRPVLGTGGFLYHAWILPAALFLLVVAAAYRPFVRDLPYRVRRLALLGGGLFVVAAVLLETLEGYGGVFGHGLVGNAQETGEMVGLVIVIDALMTYMALTGIAARIEIHRKAPPGSNVRIRRARTFRARSSVSR